jgi:hypothetical protein
VLVLDTPLLYKHFSTTETYGTAQIPQQAEVGVLTRNVVIQGDSTSTKSWYGAHLMIHGDAEMGSLGRIEQTEFRYTGQPKILGRYTIHFHMNGDCANSYVRGNAVHHSYARVTTIHAVNRLRVQWNVGYDVQGHNIFLEDGIEQYNVIEDNLLTLSKNSHTMLQTDVTVASYWITHPTNYVRRNHAGGSEFYAFWYEIKTNPDGPSATDDVCPVGEQLGEFNNNVAHSNGRFGLRIKELTARTFPCSPSKNIAAADPFLDNPSIETLW